MERAKIQCPSMNQLKSEIKDVNTGVFQLKMAETAYIRNTLSSVITDYHWLKIIEHVIRTDHVFG